MPCLRFCNYLVLVGRKIKITMDCGTTQHQHLLRWWEWEDPLKKTLPDITENLKLHPQINPLS